MPMPYSEPVTSVRTHPRVDERLEQRVHAAARHVQFLGQLPEPGGLVAAGREQFEELHGAARRFHFAYATGFRHEPILTCSLD